MKASRAQCISNLKELGTAFALYAQDNQDRRPLSSLRVRAEEMKGDLLAGAFLQLTNYLKAPRVVLCPGLSQYRSPADSWAKLEDRNIGYAMGDGAFSIGDLDIEGGIERKVPWGQSTATAWVFGGEGYRQSGPMIQWSKTNHFDVGQMGLADGTVFSGDSKGLRRQISLSQQDGPALRLFIPR